MTDSELSVGDRFDVRGTDYVTRRVVSISWDDERDEEVVTYFTDPGNGYAIREGYIRCYGALATEEFLQGVKGR